MKKYLSIFILSVALVFSLSAKSPRDPLIDFIVNIYNQKEPCTESNLLKHGFIKDGNEYTTYWNNLKVKTDSEGSLSFEFSNRNEKDFVTDWRMFLTYIYEKYDVKEEPCLIPVYDDLKPAQRYRFEHVTVVSYAPFYNRFSMSYRPD